MCLYGSEDDEKNKNKKIWIKIQTIFYNYPEGSKAQTSDLSLFGEMLDCFKQKAPLLEAMFLHIKYSDTLKDRFLKANVFAEELLN